MVLHIIRRVYDSQNLQPGDTIVDLNALDEVIDKWDGDAILIAQALCNTPDLAVGISSRANVLGAI